jgi:peroxin-4
MATKRLMKELSAAEKEIGTSEVYADIVQLEPTEDLFHWNARLRGPVGSPFEKGQWDLSIKIPQNYPLAPPSMRFKNRICHPNVNFQTGEICLDILQSQWTPAWTLLSTLMAVLLLLQDPEPNSPLNIDISNLLKNGDKKGYEGLIRYYTQKFAVKS